MLALGIGATTAIFSIVEGVLLRPLPFPNPNEFVSISDTLKGCLLKRQAGWYDIRLLQNLEPE